MGSVWKKTLCSIIQAVYRSKFGAALSPRIHHFSLKPCVSLPVPRERGGPVSPFRRFSFRRFPLHRFPYRRIAIYTLHIIHTTAFHNHVYRNLLKYIIFMNNYKWFKTEAICVCISVSLSQQRMRPQNLKVLLQMNENESVESKKIKIDCSCSLFLLRVFLSAYVFVCVSCP